MPYRPKTHRPLRIKARERRPSPEARGYTSAWRKLRAAFLASHPFCESPGCLNAATEVDHKLALRKGGTHDEANLQALCRSCHSRKTVRDDNGFGRGRGGENL